MTTTPDIDPVDGKVAEEAPESWERVSGYVQAGDVQGLRDFLQSLPSSEVARTVDRLEAEERTDLIVLLAPEDAADVLEEVPESEAVELLAELAPMAAAAIVDELRSDVQVDMLAGLEEEQSEAILVEMDDEESADVRERLVYDADTAGGLMVTEYLAYGQDLRAADVIDDLREHGEEYSDYNVQYTYVVDAQQRLTGVVPMRTLLLARRDRPLRELMIAEPMRVTVTDDLDTLEEFFDDNGFLGVPVVDADGHLAGVVHRREVQEANERQADRTYLESSGIVGGEELRSMSVWTRSRRRLSWLSVNILLNVVAASVIAAYQETLSAVIALAVFLPIISDMSGCSGNQAVAVSMRELTLGLIRPAEMLRVLWGELRVGLLNGLVLGALLGGVAWLWQGNLWLGLVVAAALALNTLVAVCLGGLVPLVLRRLDKDPALASGPILTTVTDMCGFFLVLSFASLVLPRLL